MSNNPVSVETTCGLPSLDVCAICYEVVKSDPDAIYFCDRGGICRMANPRFAETFGEGRGKLIGSPMDRIFNQETANIVLRQQADVMADGTERGCELQVNAGLAYWVCHTVVRNEEGKRTGVIGRLRSLAERKRLEKKVVETSERLMYRIACDLHDEICQELAAASLIAKLLQKRLADGDEAQAKVAAHLADLARRLAVKTRGIVYDLAPEALAGENFVTSLRNTATQLCNAFSVECGIEGFWPPELCDERVAIQLFRIAHESMHNAAKHSGGDRITVRLCSSGGLFMLSVGDNGHGILTKDMDSTGLGMASMRYRAGLIGGEICIQSTPQNGTCVTCTVPLPVS